MPDVPENPDKVEPKAGGIGHFIQKYPTFISSLVVGVAGLCATSIWQYRQSETTRKQAEAQQQAAETAAANSWKIERADILGKNLGVMASRDPATEDQRYGVLLSLARADIIDPELAVSYALELGKDNPEHMTSVLATEPGKDWSRLAGAYVLSCDERYGTSPGIDACTDALAARSHALGALVAEELPVAMANGGTSTGPLALVAVERKTQLNVQQVVGLFDPALMEMYDRRQFDDVDRFEAISQGAHLIAALSLGASRTGELAPEDEAAMLDAFHDAQTKWLSDYVLSKPCDAECRGRVSEVMLSKFQQAAGDYDAVMQRMLTAPQSQAHVAVSRLHGRLLWCQASDADVAALRDGVLVPALAAALAAAPRDAATVDALLSLIALVPDPDAGTEPADIKAQQAFAALIGKISADAKLRKALDERRTTVASQRRAPPAALRKMNFCNIN